MTKNNEQKQEANDEVTEVEKNEGVKPLKIEKEGFKQKIKHLLRTKKRKAVAAILLILAIVAVLLAIPVTRYGILGSFIKKDVSFIVTDKTTQKPVSQAIVRLGEYQAKTSSKGEVLLQDIPVGQYTLAVSKKYYKTTEQSYTVPVLGAPEKQELSFNATGRQVVVNVINKITQAAIPEAKVTIGETAATTNDEGLATIVLPADKTLLKGTVELKGFNTFETDIKVTDQADANKVAITPKGNLFYLSKQTGKINVMSADLDGSNAKVIVQGTGRENDQTTVLLSSTDWRYLALHAKRTTNKGEELYLVDAATGQLKTIDEGDVSMELVGWADHRFIYKVHRQNRNLWEPKLQSLKSYDAETGKISILDETTASGTSTYDYESEFINSPYIVDQKVIYPKTWNRGPNLAYTNTDRKMVIMSVNSDGSSKQRLREFAMEKSGYITQKSYNPKEIYFGVSIDNAEVSFYEYDNGSVKSASVSKQDFFDTFYPTYLISPNTNKTFWSDPRDGKNTLFVGNEEGGDGATLASGSDFAAYGWFSDDYVLLSKNKSELYITVASNKDFAANPPLKITNYHKPQVQLLGYGTGYGGF